MSQNERHYNEEVSIGMLNNRTIRKLRSICKLLERASSKLNTLLDEDIIDLIRNNSDIKELLDSINYTSSDLINKIK